MATVYLARDVRHDRPVALKVLHPELASALGAERFDREIKLAARLQHPNILTVHDSGDAGGQLWFTMPFIEGETLRERLRREQQLPVADALRIATEAAEALEYAHQHGVIHRDIKPENILLSSGHALVADFGIARALDAGSPALTGTGFAMGTPGYMSPEQASGDRAIDARTDVYSLGCVLYEMLAGEPPFAGPTAQAVLIRALTESPRPVHSIRAGVSAPLDLVLAKALSSAAADRYTSAAEFAAAIGQTADAPVSRLTTAHPPGRRRSRTAGVFVLGLLIGVGALFAWRRSIVDDTPAGVKTLAVLPFENLGPADQEYFAEGMTDEIRGKLASVSGLRVIAGGSSSQYKKTTKLPEQIGQELGVRYLLTGKVRWEKGADGTSRVRISPELVELSDRGAPSTKWQQAFEAVLSDVFKVQADVASQVVQALNVSLGATAAQQLAQRPTGNLQAYDLFLQGQALEGSDPATLRQAIGFYEQAVALDSSFADAWAQLARLLGALYNNSTHREGLAARAKAAATRARMLRPNDAVGHIAMASYYTVIAIDLERAEQETTAAVELSPNDINALSMAGMVAVRRGKVDQATAYLERAVRLDPRAVLASGRLFDLLLRVRRYPEARAASEAVRALAPDNLASIEGAVMLHLAEGDLAGAQGVLRNAPPSVSRPALVAYVATYWDLYWALDREQLDILSRLAPSAFDDARDTWAQVLAQAWWYQGNVQKARAYADSAAVPTRERLRAEPNDAQEHSFLGLMLAYLGKKQEAIAEGERGAAMLSIAKDARDGAYQEHQLVRIYLLVGEPEKALDHLEPLLKIPYYLSPGWLKIDPSFAPLRGNPRFERLVAGGS
jgi:serine/threonine-protein kinase